MLPHSRQFLFISWKEIFSRRAGKRSLRWKNLVLRYRELLVIYNLTQQENETLSNGGFVDIKGKSTTIEVNVHTWGKNKNDLKPP